MKWKSETQSSFYNGVFVESFCSHRFFMHAYVWPPFFVDLWHTRNANEFYFGPFDQLKNILLNNIILLTCFPCLTLAAAHM